MARGRKPNPKPSDLSIAELQELIEKKVAEESKRLPQLKKRQSDLQAELEEIETEIRAIEMVSPSAAKPGSKKRGPKPGSKRRGRPAASAKSTTRKQAGRKRSTGDKLTVKGAIHTVLSDAGKAMTTEEIREAVKGRDLLKKYSKSYAQQIALALSQGGFKRVKRGVYTL